MGSIGAFGGVRFGDRRHPVLGRCAVVVAAFTLITSVLLAAPLAATNHLICDGLAATIVGTAGNDNIKGTSGPDVIVGLDGNDRIRGMGDDDVICGGDGDDDLNGGEGDDRVFGQDGNDIVKGGDGDDFLDGGGGDDEVKGGNGDDVLIGGAGTNVIRGGKGFDSCDDGTLRQCENAFPDADDDLYSTDEDTALDVASPGVLTNDSDPDVDPLSVIAVEGNSANVGATVTLASGALLTVDADGSFTYDPNGQFESLNNGDTASDGFDYTAGDGLGGFDSASVEIEIIGVTDNFPPDARDDDVTTDEDTSLNGDVLSDNGNGADSDPDGDPLTVAEVNGSAAGIGVQITLSSGALLTQNAAGSFTYDPNGQFESLGIGDSDTDSYTYTVEDLFGLSDTATVTITITGVDDPPVAVDDTATVAEDDPATLIFVLSNDTDVDGGPRSVASVTQPANGTVVNNGMDVSYEPDANYCNDGTPTDDFTYTLAPGGSTATVRVTVTCVDDPPTAVDDIATVAENDPATLIFVLSNDTDVDGGPKSVASVTQPANGTVVNNGMDVSYEPDANYCNDGTPTDDFTYTLAPGGSTATVRVTVTCVDTPPTAVDDTATVAEDDPATTIVVLGNDTDPDGGPISVASVTQPANGTVVNNGTDVTYEPDANYCNDGTPTDDFTYTLAPGGSTATVRVTVTCVNDPPDVTAPGPFAVIGNVSIDVPDGAGDLLSNATDVDGGGPLVIGGAVPTTTANGGDLSINTTTGAFTYDPPAGFEGADSFDYQVCDTGTPAPGTCSAPPVTVTLNVANLIWFVDGTAGTGGDGRLSSPFNDLAVTADSFDANAADDAGDNIFLADGSYNGGLTLLDGQRFVGEGSSGTLDGVLGITVPAYSVALPALGGSDPLVTSSGDGIALGQNNTIRGLTIGNTTGTGIEGFNFGTLTIDETSITGNGQALDLDTGTLAVTFDSIEVGSSAGAGIDILDTTGTTNLGGVDITTTAGPGIRAINAGTMNLAGTGNTVASSNAGALRLSNTNLGSGWTFESISSTGGSDTGIYLDTTSGTGGLTVTGTGTAGSGGTISGKTGADVATVSGNGIFLNGVSDVSLTSMSISNADNFAIRGVGVNNFTLSDSTVGGTNGTSAAADEGSISFDGLTGTALFEGSTIEGGLEDNIVITNTTGNLSMTVQDSTANPMVIGLNSTMFGNDGILVETQGNASLTLVIDGVDFSGARGDMVQTNALGTSAQDVTLQNSTLSNTHPNIVSGGGGITLSGGSSTSTINVTYTVDNNTVIGALGPSITANYINGAGSVNGTISDNQIGSTGTAGSGGAVGINVGAASNLTHSATIDGNSIDEVANDAGITVTANGSSVLNANITNNTIDSFSGSGFAFTGIWTLTGGTSGTDTASMCAHISGNTIQTNPATFPIADIFVDQISPLASYNFPGYGGAATPGVSPNALDAFLDGQNTLLGPTAAESSGATNVTGTGTMCP